MIKVLKFYTETCIPCRTLGKILSRIKELEVIPVNALEDIAKVDEYNVFATPTLIFLKDDKEVKRTHGMKSEAEIRKILEEIETTA